jgi:hypothetical protein
MIYPLSLELALILTGLFLIGIHAVAVLAPQATKDWLKALPRSKSMGFVLFTMVAVWAELLVWIVDLGEFTPWRPRLLLFVPIAYVLTLMFVEEFLAARALGMLVLLAAEPLLEAAFLRPETSRLFLVSLVYVWISFALFWIGMPYTLRDQIGWLTRTAARWRLTAIGGVAYGVLLLGVRATLH